MRRYCFLILALAAVALLAFAPCAESAVDNTSHDTAVGAQGACSACHIPHKSVGQRLWPSNMASQETDYGQVGALCYYCHGSGGGSGLTTSVQNNIMTVAQGAFSHGLTSAQIPGGGNNLANATDLPYYNQTAIQCTTCHNVHDDTNRPFLRRSYETLCQDCHSLRSVTSGPAATFGAWGLTNVGSNNIYGSHPIGTDITGNVSGGNTPINFGLTAYINVIRSNAVDNWSLGGHLSAGGVMCGSCHAPHGVDTDEAAPSAELFPAPNVLVFRQALGAGAESTAANGNGEGNNHLCESCHYTTATTINAATGAAYTPTTWNVSTQGGTAQGTNYNKQPNPGGTAFTHPVDDLGAQFSAGVTAFGTADWPVGNAPGANVLPGPLCESCHTPHPNANNAARASINASTGTPILRDTAANICDLCHAATMPNHHPVGAGIMTTRFNATSSTGGTIGDGDTNLECGDCHSGAHNWTGRSLAGLDNDWVPTNNDRGANDVVGNAGTAFPNTAQGDSCKQCHMNTVSGTVHASPTKNSADDGSLVTHAWRTPVSYQDLGEGSHFLGTPDNVLAVYPNGFFAGSAIDVRTQIWDNVTGTTGTGRGGWSRWYNGVGNVGCQSCHDLQPSLNVPGTALLLGYYFDGQTEALNNANDPAALCNACHGVTPGGGTPHPMTGSTISRAVTAGRTPTTLTTGAGAYIGAGAPTQNGGTSTFPAADAMSCDSCHQPHDANSAGGTYIYEAPAANVTANAHAAVDGTNNPFRGGNVTGVQDQTFCNQCHVY